MTKYTIKNIANNNSLVHESDAETWGALSEEIQETHGTDVVRPGMKVVLRSSRQQLNADSKLPTGESEVKINLFATKLDAGLAAVCRPAFV